MHCTPTKILPDGPIIPNERKNMTPSFTHTHTYYTTHAHAHTYVREREREREREINSPSMLI